MGKQNSQNKYNSFPESAHAVRLCPAAFFPNCFELLTSKLPFPPPFSLDFIQETKTLFSRDFFSPQTTVTSTQSNCVKSVYLDLMSSHGHGKLDLYSKFLIHKLYHFNIYIYIHFYHHCNVTNELLFLADYKYCCYNTIHVKISVCRPLKEK